LAVETRNRDESARARAVSSVAAICGDCGGLRERKVSYGKRAVGTGETMLPHPLATQEYAREIDFSMRSDIPLPISMHARDADFYRCVWHLRVPQMPMR